jgi:hypothetical protein
VYGRFTDAEFLRSSANRGFVFYDVLGQQNGSLFNVSLQEATLPARD